jgi:flagellar assembly factor FliW
MQLKTTRFGTIEVDENSIITFSQPIIGFQEYRRFVLLPGPNDTVVQWLQSTDNGELAFLVMDPHLVVPDYKADLRPDELKELSVSNADELDVYTLVVVPQDRLQVRTNLKAPIVISPKLRLAKQTILDRSNYPIQYFLAQAEQGGQEHREVENAGSDSQRE